MDKAEIKTLIDDKEKLYHDIFKLNEELIELKTSEKSQANDLWNCTIWEEVINGRATDKTKKAYVDDNLREFKADIEICENKIQRKWNAISIIDDKLKYLGGCDDC